ncbi:hypothetical protein LTSEUGA_0270 [Salmonella enterica subsp. enterica serovar Uganda str. R8-3404]|uniref:Uncharacterized protein n=1 Tax=Salmonella enterica subsp. enterica serovar Uganda str. R8-3404 TaxID=913083 RepID=A0A6C8H7T0_SALET|nr:hypothetical protein LTSEUGA_0270 [Salmonella enterica subsp. enterica serovar Uganda str. R8-3404]
MPVCRALCRVARRMPGIVPGGGFALPGLRHRHRSDRKS